jgi:hypothetical protein
VCASTLPAGLIRRLRDAGKRFLCGAGGVEAQIGEGDDTDRPLLPVQDRQAPDLMLAIVFAAASALSSSKQ